MKLITFILPFTLFLKPLAPAPAHAATECDTTKNNVTICYDPQTTAYSAQDNDDPNNWIQGRCNGTVRWGDSMNFPTANEVHALVCDGEQLEL